MGARQLEGVYLEHNNRAYEIILVLVAGLGDKWYLIISSIHNRQIYTSSELSRIRIERLLNRFIETFKYDGWKVRTRTYRRKGQ